MASSKKKFSYLAIVAGAIMLVMTFVTPPAFAAEGGDSGLSKPILALAAAIAIAGGLIGTGWSSLILLCNSRNTLDYRFRSRNYLIVRYPLGRITLSIDTFIQEIQTRKKNDLTDLDKKLNDKKSETDTKKNSAVKELKDNYANEAKSKAEREGARIVEAGKLEAKKILFDAINKNLDSTFDVIKKELDGYSKKPEYKKVMQKLVDYSKKMLAKEIVVHCRNEDKSFFKSGVKVGSTIQTLGGFIAENKEGTKEIDLTFEELLRNNEDEIKNTILEKIL